MWASRYVWLATAKMAQGSRTSRVVLTGICTYSCNDTHECNVQTHHAKNLQTMMSPESWILPEEMLQFLFFRLNRKFIFDEETQSSGSKWGLKEKKFSTKRKWEYYYYLLVSNIEDAKCQPSQGCYNPSHNNDTVHQQKYIHKTKIAKFKLPIFWILNLKLDQAAATGIPQASMMTLAGIHFCCTNVMMEEWYFVCKSLVMFLIMSKFCLIILWS